MALERKSVYLLTAIGAIFVVLTWLLPFFLSPETTVAWMTSEDSFIENLSFFFFFGAAVVFFICFLQSPTGNNFLFIHTRRNYIYLLLALVFVFGAGEEIGWGQRVFGWATPDELAAINEQGETTIHNLPIFNSTNIASLFQMNRLFLMFWFVLAVAIPVAAKLSARIRLWLIHVGMPIVPLELGVVLMLGYGMSKVYGFMDRFDVDDL
ncbi:MAG: hypothetical protein U0694_14860 [Anaerolineae bacterium]